MAEDWYIPLGIEYPQEPIKPKKPNIVVPTEPIYKKPGFFNKKAVLAENDRLKTEYEEKLQHNKSLLDNYETEMVQYKTQVKQYKIDLKKFETLEKETERTLKKQWEEENSAIFETIKADIQSKKDQKRELQTIFKDKNEMIYQLSEDSPQAILNTLIDEEIQSNLQCLGKAYQIEKDMQSLGIVYSKYLDLPALTSFYEYYDSGRCNALEGPTGAYNLYESEIRADRVLEKLDVISTQLESIKDNQFLLYQKLTSVNTQLDKLAKVSVAALNKLNSMSSSLRSISSDTASIRQSSSITAANTEEIKNHTSDIRSLSAVTAYNTAVAALYSKVTAQLTDSLGYLIAMK